MGNSITDWINLARQFYPCGLYRSDEAYPGTEEYLRRIEARRKALVDGHRWLAMIRALRAAFPDCLALDLGLYNPHGQLEAAFSAKLVLPILDLHLGQHAVHFAVSFLGPCYSITRSRVLYVKEEEGGYTEVPDPGTEITAVEEPYARAIAAAIESTYPGHEPLPADIAKTRVTDVSPRDKSLGCATLADCFFSP